jgi:protein gp37
VAENSGIVWTNHTFNPWIGCTKVSAACDHCYAERWDSRFGGGHWGPKAPRRRTKNWGAPVKWNREAWHQGIRYRVFCASLADVFDNHVLAEWRADLWQLIYDTPNLDWLLLTKRPQNMVKMLPQDWGNGYPNVWLGVTVENQQEADRRIPDLLAVPAVVRFLSCEPLLGPIDIGIGVRKPSKGDLHYDQKTRPIGWVIVGGESGPGFRHTDPAWFRALRDECVAARVPFLFKQWGGRDPKTESARA